MKASVFNYIRNNRRTGPGLCLKELELLKTLGVYRYKRFFPVVSIEKKNCRDATGIPYSAKDHYLTKALMQGNKDRGRIINVLDEYFADMQPENLFELFQEPRLESISRMPAIYFMNGMPWSTKHRLTLAQTNPDSLPRNYGPQDKNTIETIADRLLQAALALETHGYKPWLFYDGFIRGYLLVDDSSLYYRFVITSGRHRFPGLYLDNSKRFIARLEWNNFLPIIRKSEVELWPQVQSGLYTKNEARLLFEQYI